MTDQSQQFWDGAHQQRYATADWARIPSLFAVWSRALLPSSGTLLEIGTGQGQDARYFAKEGFVVTASDFSSQALQRAEIQAQKEGLMVTHVHLDIREPLTFADATFDVVYAHMSLHYLDRRATRELLGEITRVLVPGGILACLLNTLADPELESEVFERISEGYYRETSTGLEKSYFLASDMSALTEGLLETMVCDDQGSSHKDPITNLVRYVGRKPYGL